MKRVPALRKHRALRPYPRQATLIEAITSPCVAFVFLAHKKRPDQADIGLIRPKFSRPERYTRTEQITDLAVFAVAIIMRIDQIDDIPANLLISHRRIRDSRNGLAGG